MAGRPRSKFSVEEIGGLFKEGLNRAVTRPTVHGYTPHAKQVNFHSAPEKGRLYIGGNRSGKTVGGIIEDIYWLRGVHPYRPATPSPVRGRIVTVSFNEGIKKIIIPELARWIPPSDLKNGSWEDSYDKSERTLTLTNGSTVELMSYDQDLDKFAGTSRHFIHFDEEPPKDIFDECRMRLIDTAGHWWITMTPVEGMTWVYDDVYLPGLTPGGNIAVITIDSSENPYISDAEIEDAISGLDSAEKQARKEGKFVQIGGLIYGKNFDLKKHVIPPLSVGQLQGIASWTHYASLDHGLNNPTCWLWHAVSPKGNVITYDEVYDNERLIFSYAAEIHERNKWDGRRPPDLYVGDPAIAQRNAQTGDSIQIAYIKEGIPIVLGNNDVKAGLEKVNKYLAQGKCLITANCNQLITQKQRYRWKIYETAKKRHDNNKREEPHKKDDHAVDSERYFYSFMPDLYMAPSTEPSRFDIINKTVREVVTPTSPPVGQIIDMGLLTSLKPQQTEWTTIDEHVGGIW